MPDVSGVPKGQTLPASNNVRTVASTPAGSNLKGQAAAASNAGQVPAQAASGSVFERCGTVHYDPVAYALASNEVERLSDDVNRLKYKVMRLEDKQQMHARDAKNAATVLAGTGTLAILTGILFPIPVVGQILAGAIGAVALVSLGCWGLCKWRARSAGKELESQRQLLNDAETGLAQAKDRRRSLAPPAFVGVAVRDVPIEVAGPAGYEPAALQRPTAEQARNAVPMRYIPAPAMAAATGVPSYGALPGTYVTFP